MSCVGQLRSAFRLVSPLARPCNSAGGQFTHPAQQRQLSLSRLVCSAASQQTQPKLSSADKKALRTKSQQQNDSLVVVQCGAAGLSQKFLEGLYEALRRNQLVKVRMGCSRQEKKDKEAEIVTRLDCVLIHSIGSTSIFFRQKGLSAPKGLRGSGAEGGSEETEGEGRQDTAQRQQSKGSASKAEREGEGDSDRPEFRVVSK